MPGTNALREECGVFRYAPDATLLPQTQQLTASLLAYFYSATLVWFYSDLDTTKRRKSGASNSSVQNT
jgi:hypothetical protein